LCKERKQLGVHMNAVRNYAKRQAAFRHDRVGQREYMNAVIFRGGIRERVVEVSHSVDTPVDIARHIRRRRLGMAQMQRNAVTRQPAAEVFRAGQLGRQGHGPQ